MLGRLLPRETSFFDLFEKHAAITVQGAIEFQNLMADSSGTAHKCKRIKEIEHEADTITHACVEALHKTFITPLDRDEIYRLITKLDDVMDYIEAASERIALYDLTSMTQDAKDLASVLVRATQGVEEAIHGLRNLADAREIVRKCIEINRLENEGDAVLRTAVARLFREEKDPIQIIKWKEIYENLENATDRCEDVANIIEGIVLERA
ncbi:MAG: DUF47 domain-containing protein [Planctomycetes bacterium]|nr:DUF47 domain-containing protein [Planctomycetota bacterium]